MNNIKTIGELLDKAWGKSRAPKLESHAIMNAKTMSCKTTPKEVDIRPFSFAYAL